jgi:hypothetical protein
MPSRTNRLVRSAIACLPCLAAPAAALAQPETTPPRIIEVPPSVIDSRDFFDFLGCFLAGC